MAYGIRRIEATAQTVVGQQTIEIPLNEPGFDQQVKAVVIVVSGASTGFDSIQNTKRMSVGMADAVRQLAGGIVARHGAAAGSAHSGWRADREHVIEVVSITNSQRLGSATRSSLGVGQVVLDWDVASDLAYKLSAWLFYGDHMDCDVRALSTPSTQGLAASTTGPGWTPDGLLAFSVGQIFGTTDTLDNFGEEAALSFGFAGRLPSITQSCSSLVVEHNQNPTSVGSITCSDRVLSHLVSTAGVVTESKEVELTSFDASGYTITNRGTDGALQAAYLAFRVRIGAGVRVFCAAELAPSSTLGAHSVTSPGFRPMFLASAATLSVAVDTVQSNQSRFSLGCATASEEGAVAGFAADNVATTSTKSVASTGGYLVLLGATNYDWIDSFTAFTASGYDASVLDASGADRYFAFMVIEEVEPAEPTGWLAAVVQRRSHALMHNVR